MAEAKKVLIVVDMQNDFVDGALYNSEALKIIPKVKDKIREYKSRGDRIIFTKDTHYSDYLKTNEGKHLPYPHCIVNTLGWDIVDGLGNPGDECIIKNTFGYLGWDKYGFENAESIEIIGVCTDICVVSNALILKATYPEVDIIVDASCCAGVTIQKHAAALETMRSCQITVIGE